MTCNGESPAAAGEYGSSSSMENTSIITYAGDQELFRSLESSLVNAIPVDSAEWRRSYSRPIKQVRLRTSFVPFSREILPTNTNWHLAKQPIFHIYWSDCTDVDVYKQSLREKIQAWLKILSQCDINDWLIVLVETYDVKKGNKLLPRATVLDKLRNDFASKQADRCISIINPTKSESRSAESWRGLITRIRHLTLAGYDKTLIKFEEIIREHRDKRNQIGWNFCHYFLLQEELAFVLEMLGLYDEALVQYDELDAMFTQFVLNSTIGVFPPWLSSFQSPLNNWAGVTLNRSIDDKSRLLLAECKASLLDFRSYLFSRQCAMLLLQNEPWEVAQRCLPFVHGTLIEMKILDVQKPEGSVECWAFLCCLEVLRACQLLSSNLENNEQLDLCSLHTASLWALAKDKLGELGKLCGLMPGSEPSSEQLHTVVYLIAGMGDSEPQDRGKATPTDKLKESLSSKDAFQKQYLEHAELAMGTYKHVGRIRSARFIGRELAQFYGELGENQKAVAFLQDTLKTYLNDKWSPLAAQTRVELAQCYKRMDDVEKYIKICAAITCSGDVLHATVRNTYMEEMMAYLRVVSAPEMLVTELGDAFRILSMEVNLTDRLAQDCVVGVEMRVESSFPRAVVCSGAALSVEEVVQVVQVAAGGNRKKGSEQLVELLPKCTLEDMKVEDRCLRKIPFFSHLDYQEDKSLGSAGISGKTATKHVQRSDSSKHRKPSVNARGDFSGALSSREFTLSPGANTFVVSGKVDHPGVYKVGQLSLVVEKKLEFLSPMLNPRLCYRVAKTPAKVTLNSNGERLAGLLQDLEIVVSTGSERIGENSKLRIRASRGLTLARDKVMVKDAEVPLRACEAFEKVTVNLKVFAELPPKKDSSSLEHKINVGCPWGSEESIPLHFSPPFMSSLKLHTAKSRKFVQVVVSGLSSRMLELRDPQLNTNSSADVHFKNLNPRAGQKLIVGDGISVNFMWELEFGRDEKSTTPIKTDFRVKYSPVDFDAESCGDDDPLRIRELKRLEEFCHVYKCNFDVVDHKTLFTVSSRIEASGTSGEFCRAGSMCHLCLTVTRVLPGHVTSNPQLMYEVLADQAMWAVCGRTAGIITLEENHEKQSVTLDVMPLTSGFLPLPVVRLSRYIPAVEIKNDASLVSGPKLEPFSPGQVYNASKALQVHVLPAPSEN